MMNMIKADLYRIVRSFGLYIGIAIMFLMLAMSIYLVQPGSVSMATVGGTSTTDFDDTAADDLTAEELENMSMSDLRELMLKSEGYELDRDILGHNMNLYYVFIFVAALAVTVDFSTGSIKNTLSSAISRRRYFISKLALITLGCLLLFFLNTYAAYFSNLIFNGSKVASSLWTVTKISLLQLPPILALTSILAGLAFTLKKSSIFNVVAIPLILVFQLLFDLAVRLFDIPQKYVSYELQIMLGRLASDPSAGYVRNCCLLCAGVIAAFTLLGYVSFRRAEIK